MDLQKLREGESGTRFGIYGFACFTVAATVFLLLAGAAVKSTESGLAVPDWPLSFGQVMPPMEGGVFYEHGHRMVATAVGALTVILALWLWMREPRAWMRRLGWTALILVIVQGLLGGLTVLMRLPTAVSVAHACVAQAFFLLLVFIALALSPGWNRLRRPRSPVASSLPALAVATTVVLYVQLILGAVTRHMNAGLVIPDVPLVFGGVVPPVWTPEIAVHYAHRIGAVVSALLVAVTVGAAWRTLRGELRRPAVLLGILVVVQITLGLLVVATQRHLHPTNTHLVVGALLLGTSLVLAARARRVLRPGADRSVDAPVPRKAIA